MASNVSFTPECSDFKSAPVEHRTLEQQVSRRTRTGSLLCNIGSEAFLNEWIAWVLASLGDDSAQHQARTCVDSHF